MLVLSVYPTGQGLFVSDSERLLSMGPRRQGVRNPASAGLSHGDQEGIKANPESGAEGGFSQGSRSWSLVSTVRKASLA